MNLRRLLRLWTVCSIAWIAFVSIDAIRCWSPSWTLSDSPLRLARDVARDWEANIRPHLEWAFSPPTDAPSYFTNETVPESARVDRAASFDNEEAGIGATTPDVEPAVSVGTDTKQYDRHASTHRSARRKAIDSGEQSVTGMAKLLNVHRVTLHKALKKDTAKRGTAA
jgi:hypothetical protein